jgi:hypothetical protein
MLNEDELGGTCRTQRENRYAFIIFVRIPEETKHFTDLTLTGRIIM